MRGKVPTDWQINRQTRRHRATERERERQREGDGGERRREEETEGNTDRLTDIQAGRQEG
eukprot:1938224-Alexandrium_andersonii.AAC.1